MTNNRLDPDDIDLAKSLEGRTIVRAKWFDESPSDDWTHHETCWLWLDDGRVVEFSSWGHDADGATISLVHLRDVEVCSHCGQAHPDSQIFDRDDSDGTPSHCYCADGNHLSWIDETN